VTEVLGEAVLDLTADFTPYESGMNRALQSARTGIQRMVTEHQKLGASVQQVSRQIDRSSVGDLGEHLGATAVGALAARRGLTELEAQVVRMRPSALGMGTTYLDAGRQIGSALSQIVADHQRATNLIVAATDRQRSAIDGVTDSMARQAMAIRAMSGDANAMRQLGMGDRSADTLMSTLRQGPGASTSPYTERQLLYGSRGSNQPGSINNPMVTTLEAGQYAAMGDRAAAIGAATATAAHTGMGFNNAADTLLKSMSAQEDLKNFLADNNSSNNEQTAALLDVVRELRMVSAASTSGRPTGMLTRGVTGSGGYREQGPFRQGGALPYSIANSQKNHGTEYILMPAGENRSFSMLGSSGRYLPVPRASSELERRHNTDIVPYSQPMFSQASNRNDWQQIGAAIYDGMAARAGREQAHGGVGQNIGPRLGRPMDPDRGLPYGGEGRRDYGPFGDWDEGSMGAAAFNEGPFKGAKNYRGTRTRSQGQNPMDEALKDYIDGEVLSETTEIIDDAVKGGRSGGGGGARTVGTAEALKNLFGKGARDTADQGGRRGGGGDDGPSMLGALLMGSGHHGGGRPPGWLGYLLGPLTHMGAGMGSVGSFAGLGPEHIIMTLAGVAGSATTAAGGAALLGGAALTKDLVGGGADALVSHTTLANTKQYMTQLATLQAAVAKYGKGSKDAKEAQASFDQQVALLGSGVGQKAEIQLAANTNALESYWKHVSEGAQAQSAEVFENVVTLGHDYAPRIANAAAQNLGIIDKDIKPLFAWLEGPQGVGIFNNLEDQFKKGLPSAIGAVSNGLEVFLKVMNDAVDDTGGLTRGLDRFFTRVNNEPPQQLQSWVNRLIGDFRTWDTFIKLLGSDLVDLFKNDAGTGKSVIVELTGLLEKVHEYETSASGESGLSNLFEQHKREILQIIAVLDPLGHDLTGLYTHLAPPLTEALTGMIKLIVELLNETTKFGPFVADMTAVALLLHKIGVLGPAVKGTATALGLLTGAEAKNIPVSSGDATALAAEDASMDASGGATRSMGVTTKVLATDATREGESVAEGGVEGAAGSSVLGRFGLDAMAGSLATKIFAKAGIAEGGSLGGITVAGLTTALGTVLAGGGGVLAGGVAQHLIPFLHDSGTRGGTAATVAGGATGVAAGAAIGSIVPVLGTAFGAAVGGFIGSAMGPRIVGTFDDVFGIKRSEDYGKKFGEGFVKQFSDNLNFKQSKAIEAALQSSADSYHKAMGDANNSAGAEAAEKRWNFTNASATLKPTPSQLAAIQAAANNLGKTTGQATVEGLNTVHPSTFAFEGNFISSLNKLPAQARPAAAQTMLDFATELANKGELPKTAVATMITGMESQFPALQTYFKSQGDESANSVAQSMKLQTAQTNLESALGTLKGQWGLYNVDPNVNGKNLLANITAAMGDMQQVIATSTGAQRAQAVTAYTQLRAQAGAQLSLMASDTVTKMGSMANAVQHGWGNARSAAAAELTTMQDNIYQAMQSGTVSTSKGMALLVKDTSAAMKELGVKKLLGVPTLSELKGDVPPLTRVKGGVMSGILPSAGGGASGAIFDVGTPGTAGHDSVPMNVGGSSIVVAPGERVAVINRHQQPIIDSALAAKGYGGLNGLFNTVKKPNYMAMGGWVPGYDTGGMVIGGPKMDYSQLEELWINAGGPKGVASTAAAIAMAESGGGYDQMQQGQPFATTGWGYWQITPGGPQYYNPMTNAREAVAKYEGAGDTFNPWTTFTSGKYRGYLNGAGPATGGLPGGGQAIVLTAPTITGGTTSMNEAGTSALAMVTKAANALILASTPVATTGGGTEPGPATMAAMTGHPKALESEMMAGAARIIGLPYTYGGGHNAEFAGTPGYDCSGAVSEVLHAGDLISTPFTAGSGGSIMQWGEPGPGKYVTVGNWGSSGENAHTMMSFFGKYIESGGESNQGPHWDQGWDAGFNWTYRHPQGLATGGMVGDFGGVEPSYFLQHHDPVTKTAAFKQYAKDHPQGRAAGGYVVPEYFASGTSDAVKKAGVHNRGKTIHYDLKGARPKVEKAKTIKGAKLPKFNALPGFDQSLMDDITTLDNYVNTDLTNYQSKIVAQHGLSTVTPTITIDTTDSSGDDIETEYVNWGNPFTAYSPTAVTGAVDPSQGIKTKSIFDRLKEIGAKGNVTIHDAVPGSVLTDGQAVPFDYSLSGLKTTSMPKTELGIDQVFLLNWEKELKEAEHAGVLFGTPTQAQEAMNMVSYLQEKDDRLAALDAFSKSSGTWIEREIANLAYHQAAEANDTALANEMDKQLQGLSPDDSQDRLNITTYFTKQRAKLAAKHLTQDEKETILLDDFTKHLSTQQQAALGEVQYDPPKGWKGDRATWELATGVKRANIESEYTQRQQDFTNIVTQNKLAGSLSDAKARLALTLEEDAERNALTQIYDNKRITIDNELKVARSDVSQQGKYVTADQNALTTGAGNSRGSLQSAASSTSFYATLQTYLDPNGTLQSSDISTFKTVNIPALLAEASGLTATPVDNTADTSSDDSAADSNLIELQTELIQQQVETIQVQAAELNVLQNIGDLPLFQNPYGGSFATGGVVPGYAGEARTIIAHGGETVTPAGGGGNVHVNVANGMGWLSHFIDARITTNTRSSVRRASRRLPSAGGGLIMGG
jgi:hypothetical protein